MLRLSTKKLYPAWFMLSLLVLVASLAAAQGDRVLVPGQPVSGALDADNAAQIYTFTAAAGESVTLTLASQTPGLALTLVLSDAQGANLGQLQITDDTASEDSSLENVAVAGAGTYYVTVFPTADQATVVSGTFSLELEQATGVAPPIETPVAGPVTFEQGQVSLLNGIEVNLRWNTQDDLNLQVRNPVGETLFWDSRSTSSGGTFGADVNGLCETLTNPPAVETAIWPSGAYNTGSYEILVYYRQACAGNVPVDFAVDVTVDGVELPVVQGALQPPVGNTSTVYITSFAIDADGVGRIGLAGPYADTRTLPIPAQELLSAPSTVIALDETVQGVITAQQPWQTFSFAGQAGDVVEISMNKTLGSLDTLVLVLDSAGNVIGANDDTEFAANTDSYISNLRLPTTDNYTLVATRYGKDIGGTEGLYELRVGAPSLPSQLLGFDLPSGDVEITLTWNTNADLQLSVRDPFGSEVYDDVSRVQSGGRLEATGNINCTISEGEPVYYIYWPEGFLRAGQYEVKVWYQSECEDTRPVIFQLFVVVNGKLVATETAAIQWNERYLTNFSVTASGEAEMGLGGIIGGSETIDVTGALPSAFRITSGDIVTGGISAANSFDLYVFDGEAGDIVTVGIDQTSGTLDTLLFVIDPNGVEIAVNDDANESTNSLISDLVLTQDGPYTIVATRFGTIYGGTTGGYELAFWNR